MIHSTLNSIILQEEEHFTLTLIHERLWEEKEEKERQDVICGR